MLRLCVLNSVSPKLRPATEGLNANTRNWFSDGYRTSVPDTNICRQDSDCEGSEICQSGYCAGIHRKYSTHGLYYGNEYKNLISDTATSLSYLEHGNNYHPHDFFYDYLGGEMNGVNRPVAHVHAQEDTYSHNFDYDSAYSR